MARPRKRTALRPCLDHLEDRSLLSTAGLSGPSGGGAEILLGTTADTPSFQVQIALRSLKAQIVQSFPGGQSVVELPVGADSSSAVYQLQRTFGVRYAELNSTVHVAAVANDPQYYRQWGLNNPNNVDIDAPEAWGVTTGSASTIVAVIDSGIDLNNPDFAGRLWTNPNGGNDRGFRGDLHGWNFLTHTGNVQDTDGHGTHVAGILAASGNNNYGVAGVNWGARIMPLKFIAADGNGSIDDAISAIYFAVAHGAKVINASWGGNEYSQALDDAIRYAGQNGAVFVTAAGNESVNNDQVTSYPADDRLSNTISVAAVDENGNLASFSNYGRNTVDLAAPGVNIRSVVPGGFATYSGTSMATPFVAGVVALVAGLHPEYSAAQLVHQVVGTAKPLPSLAGKTVSGGIVDAYNALTLQPAAETLTGAGSASGAVSPDVIQATIFASDEYYAIHGSTPTGFVNGLYQDILGRPVDALGVDVWVGKLNAGESRGDVALAILTSIEARRTMVARWFLNDLHRPTTLDQMKADPTVATWGNAIVNGVNPDDIRTTILSSDEYIAEHNRSVSQFINGLYQDLLDRPVDALGLSVWAGKLQSGASAADVVRGIMQSAEGRQTEVAQWFVTDLKRSEPASAYKSNATITAWASLLEG